MRSKVMEGREWQRGQNVVADVQGRDCMWLTIDKDPC